MYNLIKMEFYKLKHSNALKTIIIFCIIFSIIGTYFFTTLPNAPTSWRAYFINALRDSALTIILSAIFAGLFIGSDFSNNTIHHEIISGHSRREILLSRAFSFSIGSNLIVIIYPVMSIISFMALSGWAEVITTADLIYVLRVLFLTSVINTGVLSACLLIAFIVKDIGKTIGISIVFLAVGLQFLNNILAHKFEFIGSLQQYIGYGQLNIAVKDVISAPEIGTIIFSSFITLVIILSISYMSFRKAELN